LWTIYAQIACDFVDLVLDEVEGSDLNKGMHQTGWIGADVKAMPGMWSPSVKRLRK
jgi:hypothetical protein